ncbi:MAG: hypothetical protein U0L05_09155 [Schaedlerella sp.]|nr:hypothetical protein [Schaedlerella sp.]
MTRRTIRKESDVHRFMNTRCLGAMPQIRVKRRSKEVHKRLMLTESQVEEAFQESLHIIRNKIEQHSKRYNNKTFLFTSALAGEEKSTIAVNFALLLAQAGLLTDAVVLAQYADAAAIVVRKNFARVDSIMDGMEHLAESKIQIAGGIINEV